MRGVRALSLCSVVFGSALLLTAAINGDIAGVVRDPSGAVLPGVSVTVTNEATGATRSVITNETGEYAATLLPPAVYTVTAELPGFKKEIRAGVVLHVDDKLRVDFTLALGAITDTVTVNEAVPLIQSDSATLGAVIDTRKVVELPLNGRSFIQLNMLAPGVAPAAQGTTLATQGGSMNVNGAREASNNFLLDGIDNNNLGIGVYVIPISVEAVQEFKVHTGLSSVEFGKSAGAQVNVATKSGSNELHGDFFEFIRNSALDAKNFFDDPAKKTPPFKRNQFGGIIGGPFLIPNLYDGHDKTFFFFSYEGTRIRDSVTRRATVPLPVLLTGDFSSQSARIRDPLTGQPFSGNVIPSNRIDPIARALAAYYPAPNLPGVAANFNSSPGTSDNLYQYNIRLDHRTSDRDMFFGRYSRWEETRFNPFDPLSSPTNIPGFGSYTLNTGHNLALSYTHIFSPNLTNELRAGFNRLIAPIIQENRGKDIGGNLGITGISRKPIDFGFPCIRVSGFDSLCEATNIFQTRIENTFHYVETVSYTRGRHSFKAGGDVRRFQRYAVRDQLARGDFSFTGQYSGTSLSDFLLGYPSQSSRGLGEPINNGRFLSTSYFVGDDYKISDRLTFNLGLRYEYNSPPIDVSPGGSRLVNFSMKDGKFFGPGVDKNYPSPRVWNRDLNNFAPRFGFAYRPFGNDTVLRVGYGVFYDQAAVAGLSDYRFNPPFFGQETNIGTVGTPNLTLGNAFQPVQVIGQGIVGGKGVDPNYKDGYVQEWSFNIQHSFRSNLLVETSYVGTKGTHLTRYPDQNHPRLGSGSAQSRRPNPNFGEVDINESSATSNYQSGQLRIEKRATNGLAFLASYTWAKSLDNGGGGGAAGGGFQDVTNFRAERGLSNFDVRHRFSLSYLYDVPIGRNRAFLQNLPTFGHFVLSDWQFGGITVLQAGQPLTPNLSIDNSQTGASSTDRPNLIGNPNRNSRVPDQMFDPAAFEIPKPGTFGNAGRDILIGPGFNNFDITLSKQFPVSEGQHFVFRAEMFNAFNHPNFDLPNRFVNTTSFGKIFSAKAPRQIQFALKFVY